MNLDAKEAVLGLLSMGHATGNGSIGESSKTSASNHHHHSHHHQNRPSHHHHHHQHPLHNEYLPPQEPQETFMRSRPTPTAVTSSATLNSILTTMTTPTLPGSVTGFAVPVNPTTTSTIPSKRKPGHAGLDEHSPRARDGGMMHLEMAGRMSPLPTYQRMGGGASVGKTGVGGSSQEMPVPWTPTGTGVYSISNGNNNNNMNHVVFDSPATPGPTSGATADVSSEPIDCMCGSTLDDGFSIACDDCGRWCHGVCFGITKEVVPEKFHCAICVPRSEADREAAARMMKEKERLGLGVKPGLVGALSAGGSPLLDDGGVGRRRQSPGTDRKKRRLSTAGVDGGAGRQKRRPSVVAAQPATPAEDEPIDIDEHPWAQSYVHITSDIIPSDETRSKLRRQAQNWRGVTAVSSPPPPQSTPSPVAVKELPIHAAYNPLLSVNTNPQVLPPAYALHTTQPVPSDRLITPFTSTITPSSTYLSDPLNAYAHLGMPKPYVHLVGPPLDLALDARLAGNQGRFVRNGCRPNAVLRPTLCPITLASSSNSVGKVDANGKSLETEEKGKEESSLGFGVFSLRDLKAGEEIVLGWEWDDGNAVHHLPALLNTPHVFPTLPPYFQSPFDPSTSFHKQPSPNEIRHIQNQMTNILHALSSTFTTCACGSRAKDCALTQMAAFVDRVQIVGSSSASTSTGAGAGHRVNGAAKPSPHENGFATGSSHGVNGGRNGDWNEGMRVDLGPLVGRKRGFKTREKLPFSGGIGGMEMAVDKHPREKQKEKTPPPSSSASRVPVPPNFAMTASPSEDTAGARRRSERVRDKGKGRAVPSAAGNGMDVDDDVVRGRSLLSPRHIPPQHQHRRPQSPHTPKSPLGNIATPSSSSISGIQLKPPDNPPANVVQNLDEMKMPPKMRKKWMHQEVDARSRALERENEPPGTTAMNKGKEREILDDESNWTGSGWGGTGVGLGIRFGIDDLSTTHTHNHAPSSSTPPPPPFLAPSHTISISTAGSMLPPPLPNPTTNPTSISTFTHFSATTSTPAPDPNPTPSSRSEAFPPPSIPTSPPCQNKSTVHQLLTPTHTPLLPSASSSTSLKSPHLSISAASSSSLPISASTAPPTSSDSSAPPTSTLPTTSVVSHTGHPGTSPSFASPLTDFASLSLASPAFIGRVEAGYTSRSGPTTIPEVEAVVSRGESVPLDGESQLQLVEKEDDSMDGEGEWKPIMRRERQDIEAGVGVEVVREMKREEMALVLTQGEVEMGGETEEVEENALGLDVEDVDEANVMDTNEEQALSTTHLQVHSPHREPPRSRSTSITSSNGLSPALPATTVVDVIVTHAEVPGHDGKETGEVADDDSWEDDDGQQEMKDEDDEMKVDVELRSEDVHGIDKAISPPPTGTTADDDLEAPTTTVGVVGTAETLFDDDDGVDDGSVVDVRMEKERGETEETEATPGIDVEPPSRSVSTSTFVADHVDVGMDVPALVSPQHSRETQDKTDQTVLLQERPPSPSPPPPASTSATAAAPAKVKLSLRDFVLRKKKMKEQEKEAEAEISKSVQASPLSVSSVLGPEGDSEGGDGASGVDDSGRGGGGAKVEEKAEGLELEKGRDQEKGKGKENGSEATTNLGAIDDSNARAFSAAAAAIVNGFHLPKKPVLPPAPASTVTPPPPTMSKPSPSLPVVELAPHPPQQKAATSTQARPPSPAPAQQTERRHPPPPPPVSASATAPTPIPPVPAAPHSPELRIPSTSFLPPLRQPSRPVRPMELPQAFVLARQQAKQRAEESNKAGRPPIPIPASLPARPKSVRASSPPPSRSRSRSPSSPSLSFPASGGPGPVPPSRQPAHSRRFDSSSRYPIPNPTHLAMSPMAKPPVVRDPPSSVGKTGGNPGPGTGAVVSMNSPVTSGWTPNQVTLEGAAERNVGMNSLNSIDTSKPTNSQLSRRGGWRGDAKFVVQKPILGRRVGEQWTLQRENEKTKDREREEGEITSRVSPVAPASQTQSQVQPRGGSLASRIFNYQSPNTAVNAPIPHRSPPKGPRSLQMQVSAPMRSVPAVNRMGVPTAPRSMLVPSFDREEMGRPRVVKPLPFRRHPSSNGGEQGDAVEGREGVGGRNVNSNSTSNTDPSADSRKRTW